LAWVIENSLVTPITYTGMIDVHNLPSDMIPVYVGVDGSLIGLTGPITLGEIKKLLTNRFA
jgi:hypothetical protein